jgi:hypothetical protein
LIAKCGLFLGGGANPFISHKMQKIEQTKVIDCKCISLSYDILIVFVKLKLYQMRVSLSEDGRGLLQVVVRNLDEEVVDLEPM